MHVAGVSSIPLPLTYSTNCKDNLTWASCQPKRASSIYYSRPSFMIQAAPSTRKASTPFPSGLDFTSKCHSAQVEEPVDSFIDNLREGQETAFQLSFDNLQTDSSVTLLRAQEQQRLPPLELFKFTGKPIDWLKFIERFCDQIHNKTTLTDSDRMAYLFQNLDGEAKKAVKSLGVTGHSYAAALKTLKRQFGDPNSE